MERMSRQDDAARDSEFVISRILDVPREIVFDAFTQPERLCFDQSHESMQLGWAGTLDQLAAYLKTLDT